MERKLQSQTKNIVISKYSEWKNGKLYKIIEN